MATITAMASMAITAVSVTVMLTAMAKTIDRELIYDNPAIEVYLEYLVVIHI